MFEDVEEEKETAATAVGIDFGTSNCRIASFIDGRVKIFENEFGDRAIPSVVAFADECCYIGREAKQMVSAIPKNTVFNVLRLLGRRFKDPAVQALQVNSPVSVVAEDEESGEGRPVIAVVVGGEPRRYLPEEVAALLLSRLKEVAEATLGRRVSRAVLSVPVSFNAAQRRALCDSATIAGLHVLSLVSCSAAVALSLRLHLSVAVAAPRLLFIADWGGGSCETAVVRVPASEKAEVEVVSASTMDLGGADLDQRLLDRLAVEFARSSQRDVFTSPEAWGRLLTACERIRATLSATPQTNLEVDALMGGEPLNTVLGRDDLETAAEDIFAAVAEGAKMELQRAGVTADDIDDILVVGGTARTCRFKRSIADLFHGRPAFTALSGEESVVCGLAHVAAKLSCVRKEPVRSLQISQVFTTPICVETALGLVQPLIQRNTSLPITVRPSFFTQNDKQTSMTVRLYEGERALAKYCTPFCRVVISGLHPQPAGSVCVSLEIAVTDAGLVYFSLLGGSADMVHAVDWPLDRLTEPQISRMTGDLKSTLIVNEQYRKRLAVLNEFQSFARTMLDALDCDEVRDSVSVEQSDALASKCHAAIAWLHENQDAPTDELKVKLAELQEISNLLTV